MNSHRNAASYAMTDPDASSFKSFTAIEQSANRPSTMDSTYRGPATKLMQEAWLGSYNHPGSFYAPANPISEL